MASMPASERPLRIAMLAYRGNPHVGGQGVYIRNLSAALTRLGHRVTVFSGQPYPQLADGVELVRVPSLDLYRDEDPFRFPRGWEYRDWVDALEFGIMCTAGFPEPLTFSLRVSRLLAGRADHFDVVHDNQCLGYGVLRLARLGLPTLASIHHPIEVDRELELAQARGLKRQLSMRRWYGFHRMQRRVARRLPLLIAVSQTARDDVISRVGVAPERITVVPIGVDSDLYRPTPTVAKVPGRILAMASADVPLKGLAPLLEAVALLRRGRDADMVVVAKHRHGSELPAMLARLGLNGSVRFVSGVDEATLLQLYSEAEVAAVPSLYEGFSLPAVQAMACGVPVVATTAGALPEVIGRDGETGLMVRPGDPGQLAAALDRALGDQALRQRLGSAGRARVVQRYTWIRTAEAIAGHYRRLIAGAC
jgi:glycosyltransferase involved in cell wall biosynthesis